MKTRVCIRLFALALVPVLVGCDLEDESSTEGLSTCTDGQPRSAQVEYSSFTITDDQASNPANANLDRTLFRQFAQITKPANNISNSKAADEAYTFFRKETGKFTGFDADKLPDYSSVRNSFDLLEAMIASGNIGALQEARDAMANCVREDAPGSLRVDPVQVTETEGDDPASWTLGVNYAHNPEPLTNPTPFGPNISRVAFTPDSFVFTLYPNQAFEGIGPASGFKQPSKLIAGFNAAFEESLKDNDSNEQDTKDKTNASVIFESFLDNTQDDRGDVRSQTDRWSWSFEQGTGAFKGIENARCVRITADYSGDVAPEDQIRVELSSETCPGISSPADFKADHSFTYSTAASGTTQTRN